MERPLKRFERSLHAIADLLGAKQFEPEVMVSGLTQTSQEIKSGDLFLAFPGAKTHGARFCVEAKSRGARAILTDCEGEKIIRDLGADLPTIIVSDPRWAAGIVSAWFYDEPMREMYSVGITGTNGKTTTSTLLHQIWMHAGREGGLIGTVETRIGQDRVKSKRTTPESSDFQALAATMRERHVRCMAVEVSSHAIALDRVRGAHFSAAAFTNLTQDHLDFHPTMEEYFLTKASLFSFEYADLGVVNIDDPYGARLAEKAGIPILTLSRKNAKADWSYVNSFPHVGGFDVLIRGPGGVLIEGMLALHGDYNLDNALMAVALAFESGLDAIEIAATLSNLTGAQGRLESVKVGQKFGAFVDYAHSPDAVSRVLAACRSMTTGKVIAVLGCGGDRDMSKRPLMGRALALGSDVAVFTSDNPRSEDAHAILNQMTAELVIALPSQVIAERRTAIEYAVSQALIGDIVVILGKGHETGQECAGVVTPFDDRLVLAESIEGRE